MSTFVKGNNLITTEEFVTCPYCGDESKKWRYLHWKHLKLSHSKKLGDVRIEFPNHPTMTKSYDDDRLKGAHKNKTNKDRKKKVNCVCRKVIDIEVGKFEPEYKYLECCRKAGFENPDGRTKPEAQANRVKTFQEKYGVDNPHQIPEAIEKANKTCDEKYGGSGFAGNLAKKTRAKIKEKYGAENIMQTEEGLHRLINSFKQRYGKDVTNALQILEIKEKVKSSLIQFYKENVHHTTGKTYIEMYGEEASKKLIQLRRKAGAKGLKISQAMGYGPSKPQLKLFDVVKKVIPEARLEFCQNLKYDDERYYYSLDIAIYELKLNIEYDCAYTHPDPEKDAFRDKVLKSFGWKTIRYFEKIPTKEELEKDINLVL